MPIQLLSLAPARNAEQPQYRASYGDTYANQGPALGPLLGHALDATALQSNFLSGKAFFLIRGNFTRLRTRIDPILKALKDVGFVSPSLPSATELSALSLNRPLSLFSILRMHLVFEHARANFPAISSIVHVDGQPLFANGSVVPSLRYVNPKDFAECRRESVGISNRELVARMNRFIEGLAVDRGQPAPVPLNILSHLQDENKHFRITTACAYAICHAFYDFTDIGQLKEEADSRFPENGNAGPGNGTYTEALPVENGNQPYFII